MNARLRQSCYRRRMTDQPSPQTVDETPAQKALRLKKAATGGAARPGSGKPDPRAAQAASLSKSKPALRK